MKPISLRAYARHRGVALSAVQAAIESGRLSTALVDGQIRSAELADAEWAGTTREDRVPITGPTSKPSTSELQVWRTRREAAQARIAEIDLEQLEAKVINVDQARADVGRIFAIVRTHLLAVPSKLMQRRRVEPDVLALVDDLIREALTELADGRIEGLS